MAVTYSYYRVNEAGSLHTASQWPFYQIVQIRCGRGVTCAFTTRKCHLWSWMSFFLNCGKAPYPRPWCASSHQSHLSFKLLGLLRQEYLSVYITELWNVLYVKWKPDITILLYYTKHKLSSTRRSTIYINDKCRKTKKPQKLLYMYTQCLYSLHTSYKTFSLFPVLTLNDEDYMNFYIVNSFIDAWYVIIYML